jgi:hypothetical protein
MPFWNKRISTSTGWVNAKLHFITEPTRNSKQEIFLKKLQIPYFVERRTILKMHHGSTMWKSLRKKYFCYSKNITEEPSQEISSLAGKMLWPLDALVSKNIYIGAKRGKEFMILIQDDTANLAKPITTIPDGTRIETTRTRVECQ